MGKLVLYAVVAGVCIFGALFVTKAALNWGGPAGTSSGSFNIDDTDVTYLFLSGGKCACAVYLECAFPLYSSFSSSKQEGGAFVSEAIYNDQYEFSFKSRTKDGKQGVMYMGENEYDLEKGNVFLVMLDLDKMEVLQHRFEDNCVGRDCDEYLKDKYFSDEVIKEFFSDRNLPGYLNQEELDKIGVIEDDGMDGFEGASNEKKLYSK